MSGHPTTRNDILYSQAVLEQKITLKHNTKAPSKRETPRGTNLGPPWGVKAYPSGNGPNHHANLSGFSKTWLVCYIEQAGCLFAGAGRVGFIQCRKQLRIHTTLIEVGVLQWWSSRTRSRAISHSHHHHRHLLAGNS